MFIKRLSKRSRTQQRLALNISKFCLSLYRHYKHNRLCFYSKIHGSAKPGQKLLNVDKRTKRNIAGKTSFSCPMLKTWGQITKCNVF